MSKILTPSQLIGEMGEAAARLKFLSMGFQFDGRSRLEAGIDGIAEVMDNGKPLAKMIAVQVKATKDGQYTSENQNGFSYLLRSKDLEYWQGSNLPVIIVLYRQSDDSFYWQSIPSGFSEGERRLNFDKNRDVLDRSAVDRLAALTVPKTGFGYYVPPLGEGEQALVNILPLIMPQEMYVASTPYSGKKAISLLFDSGEPARFDWIISGRSFWSFHDPRTSCCREIVDLDQVEAVETDYLAFHEDLNEQNSFSFLLRQAMRHQFAEDLNWDKERGIFYFRAFEKNRSRRFDYESSKNRTHADVVNAIASKKEEGRIDFVRHHAFSPRFELLDDQWFLIITPTYFFTLDGFTPHSYPQALLAGKKRMDNSASLRGQVIMWHRFLTASDRAADDLFAPETSVQPVLRFEEPPQVSLETKVPEDVWGSKKKPDDATDGQSRLAV
jgi:hypothetical protein